MAASEGFGDSREIFGLQKGIALRGGFRIKGILTLRALFLIDVLSMQLIDIYNAKHTLHAIHTFHVLWCVSWQHSL